MFTRILSQFNLGSYIQALGETMTSRIQSWFGVELSTVMNKYFESGDVDSDLTTKYWPRALRNFLLSIFTKIANDGAFGSLGVDAEFVAKTIAELEKSTRFYFTKKSRLAIYNVLCNLQRDKIFRLRKPTDATSFEDLTSLTGMVWPEVNACSDLYISDSSRVLRRDVKAYAIAFIRSVYPEIDCFQILYDGAVYTTGSQRSPPVSIVVKEENVSHLQGQLSSLSATVLGGCDGLLPSDVLRVTAATTDIATLHEESGSFTNGVAWKAGTLGALLTNDEGTTIALGSGHVNRSPAQAYDQTVNQAAVLEPYIDNNDIDVSLLPLIDSPMTQRSCNYKEFLDMREPELGLTNGEEVVKVGHATGETKGTLTALAADIYSGSRMFYDHVKVAWSNPAERRFAFAGDCGALYCVIRKGCYVPIAIHRISDDASSYGCRFDIAMEAYEHHYPHLTFKNPAFLHVSNPEEA